MAGKGMPLAEMIGMRISKMKAGGKAEPSEGDAFSSAARDVWDAIEAESYDAFEHALKLAIKACVAATAKAKEAPAAESGDDTETSEDDETDSEY